MSGKLAVTALGLTLLLAMLMLNEKFQAQPPGVGVGHRAPPPSQASSPPQEVGASFSELSPAPAQAGTAKSEGPLTKAGLCTNTWYRSSKFERLFLEHPTELTDNQGILCKTLEEWNYLHTWLGLHTSDIQAADDSVFPTMCRAGSRPQRLEPLAGILRDPRYPCESINFKLHTDYLVVANKGDFPPESDSRNLFFDAGGSYFGAALLWFLETYDKKGLTMDEVFVWEAREVSDKDYWIRIPKKTRYKWQPKLTRYNAVPVVDGVDAEANPMTQIYKKCRPQDFCVFKLDIDTPLIENKIAAQFMEDPGNVKEFFYEHHVKTPVMGRGDRYGRTLRDSYELFLRLRQKGIRAHSWI
mmetsp:Transcript_46044/g.103414  ORF Transcript_46044/g.103414 Transcript_46044/m.103414 type:complete len:356 (-) Transcript_46044:22-1089(-)